MPGPVNRFFGDLAWQIMRHRLDFLLNNARRYGDIVSYVIAGRNFFLFSHPDAIREILVTHNDALNKGPVMERSQAVLGQGLLTSEGDFHRRQRRIAQPVFHPQRMASYSPIIVDYAQRTVKRWRDGEKVDIHAEMMPPGPGDRQQNAVRRRGRRMRSRQIGHDMDAIVRRIHAAVFAVASDLEVGCRCRAISHEACRFGG